MAVTFMTDKDPLLRYDEQNLTDEQKARARANFGAISQEELDDALASIPSGGGDTFLGYEEITPAIETGYYYVHTESTKVSTSYGACTEIIPVQSGDKFLITSSYGWASALIAEFDATNTLVNHIGESPSSRTDVTDYEYTVPDGVFGIAVSTQNNSAVPISMKKGVYASNDDTGEAILYTEQELTPEQQAQARENIGAVGEDAVKYENTTVKDITATLTQNRNVVLKTGTVNTDNLGYSTEPLNVSEGEKYLISGAYGGWFVLVAEYDSTGAFVGYVGDETISWDIAYGKEYIVPEGVASIVVCSHQADQSEPSLIKVEKATTTSATIKEKIAELDNIINAPVDSYGLPCVKLYGDISLMSKDNAVTLDYVYEGRTGTCTVKWQGSGSLQYPKKNYTIKFDTAFEAQTGWGEEKKYCLKADWADFSHARNLGAAKLWGEVVKSRKTANAKLNALVNGGAVDGFPCCVFINDEYIGLYTFNIPKDGWMLGMGDGTQEAIICADFYVGNTGSSFRSEATISEDGADNNDDFSLEYATDEDNVEWITTSANRLINACINSDGTDLDSTIAQYLDWDSAIDYYIFTALLCNHDGMRHNYLLSTYDGVKWFFTAYDMDTTFGSFEGGRSWLAYDTNAAKLYNFSDIHRAMELIELYKKDELKARYNELRQGVLSESNVVALFSNYCAKFPKVLLDEEVKIWSGIPGTSVNNFSQIIDFYRGRCAVIDKEIEQL